MSRPPSRAPAFAAAALLCLSLGLPWGTGTSWRSGPGWLSPGMCTTDWSDGTMSCIPGYVVPTMEVESHLVAGLASPARVFLVAALGAVGYAIVRHRPRPLRWAAGGLVAALVLAGPGPYGGQVAAILAAVLLVRAAGGSRFRAVERAVRAG